MLIDTHAHLEVVEFEADRDVVIARAVESGVRKVICPGITAASSRRAVELAARNEAVYAAVGVHPNNCHEVVDGDWAAIEELTAAPRVVAIGETGLDRYWDDAPFHLQCEYLERHMALASNRDLPIVLHCREAEADLLPILTAFLQRHALRGVIHSFSGDVTFARACVDLGLYLSFSGSVTYTNKKFAPLWEAARFAPADRLLVETDSPYLTPQPLRGKQKRNEPALVTHVVARLASLRETTPEAIASQTTENATRLFHMA